MSIIFFANECLEFINVSARIVFTSNAIKPAQPSTIQNAFEQSIQRQTINSIPNVGLIPHKVQIRKWS